MSVVVAASVATKWFLPESDSDLARAIFTSGLPVAGPDLVIAEVSNVAWRKQRVGDVSPAQAKRMVEEVARLFDSLVPSAALNRRAYEIAALLDHPVYDCFYVALAEELDCRFVTADDRVLSRVRSTAWAKSTFRLPDFRP